MLKIALSTLILGALYCTPVFAQTSKVDSSQMVTLRIDPNSARGAAVSQFFEEVSFIPLETTKESLFGSIQQLKVTDENYIIWDYETKAVLIFTKAGKYVAKITGSKIEKDPDDKSKDNKNKQEFYGFQLKTEDGRTLIHISSGMRIFYFDMTGKLVKTVPVDKKDEYRAYRKFPDGTAIDEGYVEKPDKDSTYYRLSLVKDKKKIASYFPFRADDHKNDDGWHGGSFYDYSNPEELLYVKNYEYNIYKLTPKKLSLAFQIFFPAANSLPMDYGTNPKYDGKRYDFYDKNREFFYQLSNTYLHGDNLYFQVRNFNWSRDEKKAFIYNLKSSELTSIADIEPDSTSQFLPVTDLASQYDFTNKGFHIVNPDYFYNSYSSLTLFTAKEQNEDKNRKYNEVLTQYFKTQNKKSNPVIIRLKPKKS